VVNFCCAISVKKICVNPCSSVANFPSRLSVLVAFEIFEYFYTTFEYFHTVSV
jgi:hypothetical protein